MPRRKKITGATAPANATASPPAPAPPDQNPDQIASIKVTGEGRERNLVIDNPTPERLSRLMAAFGTKDRDFFKELISQMGGVRSRNREPSTTNFLFSVVKNKQPRDELEAMLLVQMGACHMIVMDLTGRLNHWEEYRLFPKIMKTFADLKETFERGRKSTEHSVMVQNMTVKDGGQAIVGNVTTPRSAEPTEEKSEASPSCLPDARGVPLPRVDESPELAPCSPVAEREETQALGNKDDQ